MCVLDIIHGVLGRLLCGQLQIKVEVGIRSPHQEEELGRIGPDILDHLTQRDEFASPFGHFNLPARAQEIDHLDEHDPKTIFGIPVGLDHGLHARNIAVVVSPPDINQEVISAEQFVTMIRNVRGQIGVLPLLFAYDSILLIAKCG